MKRTPRVDDHVNRHEVKKVAEILGSDYKTAMQQGVREYLDVICIKLLKAFMQGEITELCGIRYAHDPQRQFTRHGYQKGAVTVLGGGKQPIERPRARNVGTGAEAVLDTYETFSNSQVLDEQTLALLGAGVSSRQFEKTIENRLRRRGISASAVSRRVIRSAQDSLEKFEQRRWDKTRFVSLLFDGVRVGNVMVIACIGVDLGGKKQVLGVHPGATENARVCRDLIRKLVDRGLDPDGHYLFVVDGSKALRAAIVETFGQEAVIQRCQEHKIRDVQAYLPFAMREKVRTKLQAAYNTRSYREASERLQEVRSQLGKYEQAKNSLTEGLEDTLTLHRLGIWGGLKDSLRTTNIIESAFASLRKKTRNVTNWQDEPQVNRWMAHGLLDIEQRFRTVQGRRTLTRLKQRLEQAYSARNESIAGGTEQ
jgi:putative transposase